MHTGSRKRARRTRSGIGQDAVGHKLARSIEANYFRADLPLPADSCLFIRQDQLLRAVIFSRYVLQHH